MIKNNDLIYGATIFFICALLQVYFPWWIIAFPCFIYGVLNEKSSFFKTFLIAFASIGLLWGIYAAFIQLYTGSELSRRISVMFQVPSNDFIGIITGLIGGLTAGLTALCGALVKWSLVDLKPVKVANTEQDFDDEEDS
ncbi:hypothetical protein KMW28_09915 [Flammeovirga yaeyamensis]|uniref:Uncharacterized protein n=1 Tax=Flammeovirga yaeyamensis TaxID=367791 RepID=A0AAX1N8I6_9BACT|nr:MULTISPECIES: hypothetical protein [Flammeovirga]ANQ48643.1 hypothetical protein MY04_1266 [Flammeovirga sp. MY04]MBB3698727.1 putative membrane protein [Flammeovirga yaeyamensis]NMF37313.1 hypothetical protein [Flammeovirga yaeyamensis]QWG03869.1 hypothetical protein KMW28_09915 [Flammeovirga yaeyamensis]